MNAIEMDITLVFGCREVGIFLRGTGLFFIYLVSSGGCNSICYSRCVGMWYYDNDKSETEDDSIEGVSTDRHLFTPIFLSIEHRQKRKKKKILTNTTASNNGVELRFHGVHKLTQIRVADLFSSVDVYQLRDALPIGFLCSRDQNGGCTHVLSQS